MADTPDTPLSSEALASYTPPPPPPPKRIGRPPGSKNRSTLYREQQAAEQRSSIPSEARIVSTPPVRASKPPPPAAKVLTDEEKEELARKKLEAKRRRAAEYEKKITEDVNDFLMSALIAVGMPVEMLYRPGMEPVHKVRKTNKYTDLGNILAISDLQASVWGRFAAELESTGAGTKVTNLVSGDSKIPLYIYGAGSLVLGIQYMRGVLPVIQKIALLQQAKMQADEDAKKENSDG